MTDLMFSTQRALMTGYYRSPSSFLSKKVFSWPMYNNDHCLLAGKPKGNGDCSACIICRLNVVMSKTISNGVFHHISLIPINCLIITLRSSLQIDPPNQQHQWPTRSTSLSQWPQDEVYLDMTIMNIICDYLLSPIPITTRSSTPKSKTRGSMSVRCRPQLGQFNSRFHQMIIMIVH